MSIGISEVKKGKRNQNGDDALLLHFLNWLLVRIHGREREWERPRGNWRRGGWSARKRGFQEGGKRRSKGKLNPDRLSLIILLLLLLFLQLGARLGWGGRRTPLWVTGEWLTEERRDSREWSWDWEGTRCRLDWRGNVDLATPANGIERNDNGREVWLGGDDGGDDWRDLSWSPVLHFFFLTGRGERKSMVRTKSTMRDQSRTKASCDRRIDLRLCLFSALDEPRDR